MIATLAVYLQAEAAFSQLVPALMGTHEGVIYSWLFRYTQQQTAGFTEISIGPAAHKAGPVSM